MLLKRLAYFVLLGLMLSGVAYGSVINESRVVAVDAATAGLVPDAKTFTIATAGSYTVTITDIGKQYRDAHPCGGTNPPCIGADPLSSLSLVITQGDQLIKLLSVDEATTSVATGTVTLNAGTYSTQVLGTTTTTGLYSVNITGIGSSPVFSDGGAIVAASSTDVSSLTLDLSLTQGQSYTVALKDLAFPVALDPSLTLIVVAGDGTPLCRIPSLSSGDPGPCSFVAASTNQLFVSASLGPSASAGLYGIKITDSSSAIVLANTYAVGTMPDPVSITLPTTAGDYSFTATDIAAMLPSQAALSSLKLALVQDGDAVVPTQNVAGTTATNNFSAVAGVAKLYVAATANSIQGTGSYLVQIKRGSASVYTHATAVTAASTSASAGFTFEFNAPSGGPYSIKLTDFNFPQTLATLSVVAIQSGTVLGSRTTAGTLSITAQTGEVELLVLATPGTAAQGLFGLSAMASGATTNLFAVTQGVGGMFTTIPVTLSAETYKLNVTDLAAPQVLSQLYVIVTRGSQSLGTIYGGTTTASTSFDATAGDYTLNVIANTKSGSSFGMYGISLSTAPVITFTSNQTSVSAGSSVTLTWSTTDATACTASGGWSGAKATSGSQSFGPINSDVALTLTCTGLGGSSAKTVNIGIAVTAASSSHGGGGALSWLMLLGLTGLVSYRAQHRKRIMH